jgi:predicted MFS family arabinose efflux permease
MVPPVTGSLPRVEAVTRLGEPAVGDGAGWRLAYDGAFAVPRPRRPPNVRAAQLAGSPARQAAATVSISLAVAMLPMFLFGALSATIGEELGFDEARTGIALTGFFLAAAVSAVPIGRLTERIGARRAIRIGVAVSALASLVIGTVAAEWWVLAVALVVAGGVLPFVDTGGARAFTTAISARRRGLAFGVKEASVPFASMLAGLAVPLLAATIGWRAAFVAAAVIGPVAWVGVGVIADRGIAAARAAAPATSDLAGGTAGTPTTSSAAAGTSSGAADPAAGLPPAVRWYAAGFALAGGASATALAFLVPSAIAAGMTAGAAGTTLAVASVSSIAMRLVAGWGADRFVTAVTRGLLTLISLGALGALLLALEPPAVGIVVAAFLLLAGGAGWTGLGFTAVVRAAPILPASASALALTGLAAGGTVGPTVFGATVSRAGYGVGWALLAAAFALGAVLVAVAARRSGSAATAASASGGPAHP